MSDEATAPADRLRAALAAASISASVRNAWISRPPTPASGQLWRARWGDTTSIVLIVEALARAVRVVPATLDAADADESAVVAPPHLSALAVPLVLWLEHTTAVPLRVLDRFLGDTLLPSQELPTLPHGTPVRSPLDDRTVERARITDALERYTRARWAPEGEGGLADILRPVDGADLARVLDASPREVIALRRGQRPLTPEQAVHLAPVVGRTPADLLRANPALPEDLVADLDLPEYRAQVVADAARRGVGEIEAWLAAGYNVFAGLERNTGAPTSWRDRLDQYFRAALGE